VSPSYLRDRLAGYAAGLEAQVALLRRVQELALEQRSATEAHEPERLTAATEERGRLMAGVDSIEREIQPSRAVLADNHAAASELPGFDDVVALHRRADALVAGILAADQATIEAIRRTDTERRDTSHALDTGETTLAAYRRVIAPGNATPSLVDRRG
jgi:hypothetical protein